MTERSEFTHGWPVVLGAFIGLTLSLGTIVTYSFGVFAVEIAEEFGWSRAEISFGITAHNMGLAIAAPLVGWVTDRYGARRYILLSVPVFALLIASLSRVSSSVWNFYAILAVLPLLAGGAMPIAYSRVVIDWFDARRGLALGLALSGVGMGAAIVPPLSGLMIAEFGWRGAYIGLAVIIFAVSFPTALLLIHSRSGARVASGAGGKARENRAQSLAVLGRELRSRVFLMLALLFFASGLAIVSAIVNLVPLLVARGISPSQAATISGVLGVSVMAARVLVGFLLDRFFAPRVFAAVFLGPALGYAIFAAELPLPFPILAAVGFGLAVGAEIDIIAYLTSRYFPMALFSKVYGFLFSVFIIGGGIGPLLYGSIVDRSGTDSTASFFMLALSCVCIAMSFLLPGYARHSKAA